MPVTHLFHTACDFCEQFMREDGSATNDSPDAARFYHRKHAIRISRELGWEVPNVGEHHGLVACPTCMQDAGTRAVIRSQK